MDYIIFGTGSSATLVLIGWLIRDWGPRLRDRKPAEDEILSASDLVIRMAWARFCASGGMALLICGVLITLATLGAALLAPTDRSATIAVIATFGLTAILMLIWTGLYLRQFGTMGVIRPRPKREKPETTVPAVGEPVDAEATDPPDIESGETAAGVSVPNFAEATVSRGGLRRFSSFFRKEPVEGPVTHVDEWDNEPETDPDWAPEVVKADVAGDAPTASPTDAVIAELAGDGPDDGPNEKNLRPDDPLVTSVRREADAKSVEHVIVSDVVGEAPRNDPSDESSDSGDDAIASTDETPDDGTSSPESAIDQLRRRRMSRLANPGEPD